MSHDPSAEHRFRHLFDAHFDAILGYALRRAGSDDAADVAADTFLVAWRRLDDVPDGPDALPWLYGVARRTLANQRRGRRRRGDLAAALRTGLTAAVPDHADATVARLDAAAGIAALPAGDREVLRLATWEGLEPREIGLVLGVGAATARKRLSRARARLRSTGHVPGAAGHNVVETDAPTTQETRR